jgi:hypothetical protein
MLKKLLVTAGTHLSAFIIYRNYLENFQRLYQRSLMVVFKLQENDNELLVKELIKLAAIWRRFCGFFWWISQIRPAFYLYCTLQF